MKTNLKNQKGITLVALVVTIIVLLILAGVSLSLVAGGNGIINKSVRAVDETKIGAAKEQTELKLAELVADYYEARYVDNDLKDGINDQLGYIVEEARNGIEAGDYTITVVEDGTLTVKNGTVTVATGKVEPNGKMTDWKAANKSAENTTNNT